MKLMCFAGTNWIPQDNFSEPFRLGQVVYGRVMWHPGHDLSPGYDLTIDKVFMCAGRDGYVPVYEPNAERPQFGCMEKSAKLKYRILLLVRKDLSTLLAIKKK